jgi:hypothetical protein
VISQSRLAARAGQRVRVPYVSTDRGTTTLEVLRGRRRVARVTGRARQGRNSLAWNGRISRRRATPGRYTLRLRITGLDGQTATDTARLTLRRR